MWDPEGCNKDRQEGPSNRQTGVEYEEASHRRADRDCDRRLAHRRLGPGPLSFERGQAAGIEPTLDPLERNRSGLPGRVIAQPTTNLIDEGGPWWARSFVAGRSLVTLFSSRWVKYPRGSHGINRSVTTNQ